MDDIVRGLLVVIGMIIIWCLIKLYRDYNEYYRKYFKEYKYMKEIKELKGHVIICGYGRVGSKALETLQEHNHQFLIIEQDQEIIDYFRNETTFNCLKGNATHDELLTKSGIENAEALITTLPSDADNLFVVLTARELNKNLKIISRASKIY